jgi:GNAT superfamily N-acetyltransferase
VVNRAYGLPEAVDAFTASVPLADGWSCWLALEGDTPVGGAALWSDGTHGYLGFAGTEVAHRGKGAQGALFAARIDHARALGCRTLVTETGEQLPGRPSDSYRNIVRFGFREAYVVAHRLSERVAS